MVDSIDCVFCEIIEGTRDSTILLETYSKAESGMRTMRSSPSRGSPLPSVLLVVR